MLNVYHFSDHSSYLVLILKLSFPKAVEQFPLDSHQVANKKAIHVFHYYTTRTYTFSFNVEKSSKCHEDNIEKVLNVWLSN